MHAGVKHLGKIPAGSKSRVDFEQSLELIRKELQEAVEREDFEKAAEIYGIGCTTWKTMPRLWFDYVSRSFPVTKAREKVTQINSCYVKHEDSLG